MEVPSAEKESTDGVTGGLSPPQLAGLVLDPLARRVQVARSRLTQGRHALGFRRTWVSAIHECLLPIKKCKHLSSSVQLFVRLVSSKFSTVCFLTIFSCNVFVLQSLIM